MINSRFYRISRFCSFSAVSAATAGLLVMLASSLAHRWGWVHFSSALLVFKSSAWFAWAAAILGPIAILVGIRYLLRVDLYRSFAAMVAGIGMLYGLHQWEERLVKLPPIHDISTDMASPPQFIAIAPLRASAPNPIDYDPQVGLSQQQAYADIQPIYFQASPQDVFARVMKAAKEMGWEIVAADPASGRVEATATTLWFGLKDDVVIRIAESKAGETRLDIRSVSRVDQADAGRNAERVRAFRERVSR